MARRAQPCYTPEDTGHAAQGEPHSPDHTSQDFKERRRLKPNNRKCQGMGSLLILLPLRSSHFQIRPKSISYFIFLLGCGKGSGQAPALWPSPTKASPTSTDAPFSGPSQKSQLTYIFKTPKGLPNPGYYSSGCIPQNLENSSPKPSEIVIASPA